MCTFKKQVVKQRSDTSYELVTPDFIAFAFAGDTVEFAIFDYGFPSWPAMDLAKQSVQRHMNRLFPLTATKLSDHSYKLNNTKFFLEFMGAEDIEVKKLGGKWKPAKVFHLAIGISREKMTVYLDGDPLVDEDTDTDDADPLRGLDGSKD